MSEQLQLIYVETLDKKQKKRELLADFNFSLKQNADYERLIEDISELRDKKKGIEDALMVEMGLQVDDLKREINMNAEMMNDLAINGLMAGSTVEVHDKFGNRYEPVWKVSFKKIKDLAK